jgi:hypothetical protein
MCIVEEIILCDKIYCRYVWQEFALLIEAVVSLIFYWRDWLVTEFWYTRYLARLMYPTCNVQFNIDLRVNSRLCYWGYRKTEKENNSEYSL